jgi:hypothetical protein
MFEHSTIPDDDWDALRRSADIHGDPTIGEHISSPGINSDAMPADNAGNN